ncbi:hypothetical protein C8R42DRAFT_648974 [Lentinula raphanica]|nr:hypothetical protein C8R42DRAFT_648974 [Lentinula raphanica]
MPSGVKRGAGLSLLYSDPDENHSTKRLHLNNGLIEVIDDECSSAQATFITPRTASQTVSSGLTPACNSTSVSNDTPETSACPSQPKRPHKPPSQDFLNCAPLLIRLLTCHEYDPTMETPCDCGRGIRRVQCQDCHEYQLSCGDCWVKKHFNNPWHWARVWDGSFFVRSDISTLRENHAVQLGHHGQPCPTLDNPKPVKFTVVHSNGVHGTRISFCNCGSGSRVEQLMRARLFPSSLEEPQIAFTFTVMREYDIHSLQGKIPAYDYVLSLRRLTDNIHMDRVNDPYQPFMLAARAWRYLKAQIRLGGVFKINERYLPHRPANSLIVQCPMCPDPAINMVGDWWNTPLHYRDGNCKMSQFHKNSTNEDKSFYRGNSYFPPLTPYKDFLESAKKTKHVSTSSECGHIKVINRQLQQATKTVVPKKKVGVVSTACSHVFILATTDMYGAENQAHVDASFAHAYHLYSFRDGLGTHHRHLVRHKHTYDAQCDLSPNVWIRFARFKYLNPQRNFIRQVERGVPVVHIARHSEEDCQVQYNVPHHWCNGHVEGETIEQPWVEFNQVGAYSRQMNDANREDTIIAHIHDWNHKKLINGYEILARQLLEARIMFQEARDEFELLSHAHKAEVPIWSRVSRQPFQSGKNSKIWTSVYNRHHTQIPTVRQLLLSISREEVHVSKDAFLSAREITFTLEGYWNKAIEAVNLRATIRECLANLQHSYSERDQLHVEDLQVPPEHFAHSLEEGKGPEDFCLGLPSDLTAEQRESYTLHTLAQQEARLRESQLQSTIASLKHTVSRLLSFLYYKSRNVDTEKLRTRTGKSIMKALVTRDILLAAYNEYRHSLIQLGALDDCSSIYPHLSPSDTFKKDPNHKRRVGDSRRCEGLLWTVGEASKRLVDIDLKDDLPIGISLPSDNYTPKTATRSTNRKQPSRTKQVEHSSLKSEAPAASKSINEDKSGVLWSLGTRKNSNTISWYRSEALMYRWLETFEQKHGEFQRYILTCKSLANLWTSAANDLLLEFHQLPQWELASFRARGLRQAAIFEDLSYLALRRFEEVAHPAFLTLDSHLSGPVDAFRQVQLQWMSDLDVLRADLAFGSNLEGMYSKPVPRKKEHT